MSRNSKASSETPDVDYVVNALEVLGGALVEVTTAVVLAGCSVLCCTALGLYSLFRHDP